MTKERWVAGNLSGKFKTFRVALHFPACPSNRYIYLWVRGFDRRWRASEKPSKAS